MCEDLGPYFPESSTCSCLDDPTKQAGTWGIGCATWGYDTDWCYVDPSCTDVNVASVINPGLWWSNGVCKNDPKTTFPETASCSCLTDTNGPSGKKGIGCAEWDSDGVWCYVDNDCNLPNTQSNH